VVFGEDGEVCALGGGFADVGLCAGKVAGNVEWLFNPLERFKSQSLCLVYKRVLKAKRSRGRW
jgi:hypothetical protein